MSYMTVETTNLQKALIFSMMSNKDIQNGAIVGKGALVTGETEIYNAIDSYADDAYLVAHPAWSYDDSSVTRQNEEEYINKAGIPFRVYKLQKDHKFKVANVDGTFAIGDTVKYDATSGKYVADTVGKEFEVVDVEEVGFPFCIGSSGVQVSGDTANNYGYALGQKVTKYTIQKIK